MRDRGALVGTNSVNKQADETLSKIVETQVAMRVSIDEAKRLAAESERLLKKHGKRVAGTRTVATKPG